MRLTIALTTYERPDALAAVLDSLARQSEPPDEIVIADDGSGERVRAIVEQFKAESPIPVHHVWQEHQGFRVARLRNLAIAKATGDYIVFIDGDMLLHPSFVADHRHFARRKAFTQGVRIPLDEQATRSMLTIPGSIPGSLDRRLRGRRSLYSIHSRVLAPLTRKLGNGIVSIKSCNQGFWRSDLVAVNGFDEEFVGWGSEDKDLCARLIHHGIARQTLLFGGIAFHLHHPPASRERHAANERRLAASRSQRRVRCARGLDAHLRSGQSASVL
jgi:glycosyltransferase involved in cell wall biosynthesis